MPFVKGQSGNPKGGSIQGHRSKALRELAQRHCPKAVKRLAEFLDDDDHAIAVRAADLLMERGYGKPIQTNEVAGTITIVCKGMPNLSAKESDHSTHL